MSMSSHRSLMMFALCLPALAMSLTACNTTTPEDYPVIHSHGHDGQGSHVTPDASALQGARGFVLSYSAGDTIEIELTLDSNVMKLAEPVTITLVLEEPIRVANDPDGMRISLDGGPWQDPWDAFNGALSTGFSIRADDPVNRGTMQVTAIAN